MKSDVLKELPSKVIQDYFCPLTEFQRTLYTIIVNNCGTLKNNKDVNNLKKDVIKPFSSLHTLILLRKLVDHPLLVAKDVEPLLNEEDKLLLKSKVLYFFNYLKIFFLEY